MKWVLVGIVLFTLPLLVLYQSIVGTFGGERPDDDHHDRRGLPVLLGVGLHGRPGRLVEQSGVRHHHRHDPVRLAACWSLLIGRDSPIGPVAAIMIGAVVCCAACIGGDNLQDLKAGYIVGATPWKQQLMLGIGAFSCALVMAPVLNLLADGLRHRRTDRGASEFAARAAGDADGVGRAKACSAARCRGR